MGPTDHVTDRVLNRLLNRLLPVFKVQYTAISIKVVLRAERKSRIRARKAAGNR
jgi:hypothetical protein